MRTGGDPDCFFLRNLPLPFFRTNSINTWRNWCSEGHCLGNTDTEVRSLQEVPRDPEEAPHCEGNWAQGGLSEHRL